MLGKAKADSYSINKYKPELGDLKVLHFMFAFLFLGSIIMPQYFGVRVGYDITCARMGDMMLVAYMLMNTKILTHFLTTSAKCKVWIPLGLYIFVAFYTMVFRTDINALFLVALEVLAFFLMIYGIRYVIGYRRAIKWFVGCAYFFAVYGFIEFVYGRSIFLQFLATMPTDVKNSYRSGHYRIMGPCGHSLGYGLLLILFIAIICIDLEKNELYLFKRPVLLVMLLANVFLTGSRSTLGIAVAEAAVIMIFSGRRNFKKSIFMLVVMLGAFFVLILLTYNTGIGRYLMGQITSVIDQFLGTSFAAQFGVDVTTLQNSEAYRDVLPYIFTLDWLNPLVGRGRAFGGAEVMGVYVHSIDNYYVAQYIKYAYPGLVTYVLFMLFMLVILVRDVIISGSAVTKAVLIGGVFYFVNLWWMDALQTLKFMYIVFAIFYACYLERMDKVELEKRNRYEAG